MLSEFYFLNKYGGQVFYLPEQGGLWAPTIQKRSHILKPVRSGSIRRLIHFQCPSGPSQLYLLTENVHFYGFICNNERVSGLSPCQQSIGCNARKKMLNLADSYEDGTIIVYCADHVSRRT